MALYVIYINCYTIILPYLSTVFVLAVSMLYDFVTI